MNSVKKILRSNENDITFCKTQILYYQDLLQDLIDKREKILFRCRKRKNVKPANSDIENEVPLLVSNNEVSNSRDELVSNSRDELEAYKSEYIDNIRQSKKNKRYGQILDRENIEDPKEEVTNIDSNCITSEDDYRRIRMRQLDSRKGLQDNERVCDEIRKFEQDLIESGVSPRDAQTKAIVKYYPESIPAKQTNIDGTESRSHELLTIGDSDYESDEANLEKEINNVIFEDLLVNSIENNIEDGNNIDPEDILQEKEILEL